MRILIINYYYPPVVNAHAYRWEQIARHWVSQGHQVEVITGRILGVSNYSEDGGVCITRVGLIAMPIKHSSDANVKLSAIAKFRNFLLRLLRPTYRFFYWPDAFWHWIPSVIFEALRRRSTKYDLVVSYYPCIGAHLAAAALKKWTKYLKLTWIADYGDPFSTSTSMPPNNFSVYSRLNSYFEKKIINLANFCVFTNENTAAKHRDIICKSEKIRVIPHLVDVKKFYTGKLSSLHSSTESINIRRELNLLYIGGFHRGIREPAQLFDLIRQLNIDTLNVFKLTIFGPENGFDLSLYECPNFKYMGEVERDKAVDLMREADILINVDNENCVMVPSKLVEYIGTGKPLLNLGRNGIENIALQRYVEDGHALLITPNKMMCDQIILIKKFILNKSCDIAPLHDVLEALYNNTLEVIADKYKNILIETD